MPRGITGQEMVKGDKSSSKEMLVHAKLSIFYFVGSDVYSKIATGTNFRLLEAKAVKLMSYNDMFYVYCVNCTTS
jgi:hypothetical protein